MMDDGSFLNEFSWCGSSDWTTKINRISFTHWAGLSANWTKT